MTNDEKYFFGGERCILDELCKCEGVYFVYVYLMYLIFLYHV